MKLESYSEDRYLSKSKIKSIRYNVIMSMILKISSIIFPLITFPYISRTLLAIGNGKIAFASSVISYFTMFASLGVPTYGIKICAQCRENRQKLSKIVKEILIINIICICISYSMFIIAMLSIPKLKENSVLLWINSISIILSPLGVEWFFQAIEQYDYITFRNIAFKVISIILMFIFVHEPKDYIIYGGISVIAACGSNLLNFYRMQKYIDFTLREKYNVKRHLKPILLLFMMTITTTVYTNLDSVMLGFISGDEQVGFYNAAIKTKGILLSFITALSVVLLPRASYYIENNMKDEFKRIIIKSFQFTFLLGVPTCIYFIINASTVLELLSGSGYAGAIIPMQIIMPTVLLIGLNNITGMQILLPLSKEKYTVISTLIGAFINILFNIVCIPLLGAIGAAIGTLIAEGVVLIVQIMFIGRDLKCMVDIRDCIKVILATIVSVVILSLVINIGKNDLTKIILTGISFFGSYIITVILLKEKIVYELAIKIFNKLVKRMRGVK